MELFRILEHTADIGFEAFGATREGVFANAARALFHIIVELDSVEPRETVSLHVEGADPPRLLVNWLSELLYLQDTEGWLFREFATHSLLERSLAAARGERGERARPGSAASSRIPHRNWSLSSASLEYTLQLGWSAATGLFFIQPPQTNW